MKKISCLLTAWLLLSQQTFGFFNEATSFEVRATASAGNINGGTFISGASGTDYSMQDTPQYNIGGISSAGAGNVLLSTSAANDWVGNGCYSVKGTNIYTNHLWQITAVTAGVDFTVVSTGTTALTLSTGVVVDGEIRIGGAFSLGSSSVQNGDDVIFESLNAGNTMYIKAGGIYNIQNIILTGVRCTMSTPCFVIGYDQVRNDDPTPFGVSTNAPVLNWAANSMTSDASLNYLNLYMTGTNSGQFGLGVNSFLKNTKSLNTSASVGRSAFNFGGSAAFVYNSEFISQNGVGITYGGNSGELITGSYIHDSNQGVAGLTAGYGSLNNSVIAGCLSGAMSHTANTLTSKLDFNNNTFIGFNNLSVSTLIIVNSSLTVVAYNNIFYGGWQAIRAANFQARGFYNYNNLFYGFTSTFTNVVVDTKTAYFNLNPNFTNATEIFGTTASISGTNLIMDGGGMFANAGITDNRDFLNCHWGAGATVGNYLIIGHSSFSVTLNNTIGTNTNQNKVFTIRIGKNFNVGTTAKALGNPFAIVGSSSTSYIDLGAVQRQEPTGSGTGFIIQ